MSRAEDAVEDVVDAVDAAWHDLRNVRFASISEMFDTEFYPPSTVGMLMDRWGSNSGRFWPNYSLAFLALCPTFGLRIGMWMALALVSSHASLKKLSVTSVVKSKVAKFFD